MNDERWNHLRILVTGGMGYIGSETARQLAAKGAEVHVLDNLSEGHEGAWDGPFTLVDLEDQTQTIEAIPSGKWDAVMHFSARCYVGESTRQPIRYWRANITPILNLLDALPELPFILSSSCATFGNPVQDTIDERHPQAPVNPYGATKLAGERILHDREKANNSPFAILRYFNAAGATEEHGEDHRPETHLIPLAIKAALETSPPLTVFGTDYDTPDGTCIRDYIHVADLARAHLKALEWILDGKGSNHWNLGTGTGASIMDVLRAIESISGRPVPWKKGERRTGDPSKLVANPSKAESELGWVPEFRTIEDIVATAISWHQKRPSGYRVKNENHQS